MSPTEEYKAKSEQVKALEHRQVKAREDLRPLLESLAGIDKELRVALRERSTLFEKLKKLEAKKPK